VSAIQNNPNLFAALDRVIEARAQAGVEKSQLYPQFNVNPSFIDNGQLFKIYLPNTPTGTPLFQNIPKTFRIHQMQYSLPVNMSYELDLWGKLKGEYKSAFLSAQSQEEAFRTTLLTLTTDLASYYFQLRALDSQVDLLKKTIESRQKAFDLAKERFNFGIVPYSDVTQASVEVTNAESEFYDAVRQRNLQENQIAVLIGIPASLFSLDSNPLKEQPPQVPGELPSEVLKQRPDIAEAEKKMASEHALIGVAYASFFPSIELTGTLGFLSPDFKNFLKWRSRFWQIGINILQTLFDGGHNTWNLELSIARYKEATEDYKQQILVAFREVEDALNNIDMQRLQGESLKKSSEAAEESSKLSFDRYYGGVTFYVEVVNNERTSLEAQRQYIIILGAQYISTIQLIKALGGSWNGGPCF